MKRPRSRRTSAVPTLCTTRASPSRPAASWRLKPSTAPRPPAATFPPPSAPFLTSMRTPIRSASSTAGSPSNPDLPGHHEPLLGGGAAAGKPVVLLVFSGRPLVLNWAAEHVPAILEAWFPGTEAGHAIANVLY